MLVYILDEGSVFDAPLDKIMKYRSSEGHQHPSVKLVSREIRGDVIEMVQERNMGKPMRIKVRNTMYPPFGMVQEFLEGPMAGSTAFQFFIPRGDKTGVTVVGDYLIEGENDARVKEIIIEQNQTLFDEDNYNLKKMV